MFDLGFTMEELMFPENYQFNTLFAMETDTLLENLDDFSSVEQPQHQIMIDDDDWFTMKQLNPGYISTMDTHSHSIDDQSLPLLNDFTNASYLGRMVSMVDLDNSIDTLMSSNLSIQVLQDKNDMASSLDPSPCEPRLLITINSKTPRQLVSNSFPMSKSTSSLSFGAQSAASTSSSTVSDMSPESNDFNETRMMNYSHHSHYQKSHSAHFVDDSSKINNRHRRKRTIFTSDDIEHLKEAFAQNPKPSQQDIAILSEQLGHDSYVIRVWFYNKRQASKKRS